MTTSPDPARPLKVLFLINRLGAGGAERFCIALANQLAEGGHDVSIQMFYTQQTLPSKLSPKVRTVELDFPPRLRIREMRRLIALLRDERPDVLHGFLDNANRYGLVAARLAGVPAVISSMQNTYAHLSRRYGQIDRFAFRFADAGVPCAREVEQFYIDSWHFPPAKLHTLPNAVEVAQMPCRDATLRASARAELGLAEGQPAFVTVASLNEQKGHRFLLEAIGKLGDRHPDAHWFLLGDGPLRAPLEAQIAELGLGERVTLLGIRGDVPRLLQGMDLFVMPSLWEGLSLAMLEASAAGLPLLVTDVSGTKAIVEPGRTGWVVAPGDADALATAMSQVLDHPESWAVLGQAGRRKMEVEFGIEPVAAQMLALYREVLARRGR